MILLPAPRSTAASADRLGALPESAIAIVHRWTKNVYPPPARLVHVAIELFYSHGFQAVGGDQILAAAGVTKTTFYKHFESKDALLVRVSVGRSLDPRVEARSR